jgi:O-antigen/teichoic acid export membrane protein
MTMQAAVSAAVISVCIAFAIPYLGHLFDRPEFVQNAPTLWLMLLAIWLKSVTESLYFAMYARHQDTPIWLGNIVLLIVAFLSSYWLIPPFGFIGIGYSAVIASIFLCIWRLFAIRWLKSF